MKKTFILILFLLLAAAASPAQTKNKYSYLKQKQFIPVELGKVYLGMPFADFARQIDLKNAEVDNRFEWLEATLPFAKGNIESINFKVYGLTEEDNAKFIYKTTTGKKTERNEDYEVEVQMIDPAKIPAKGIVYEISLRYKKAFDLKAQAIKMFGVSKDVYKAGDQFHIYDMQWTKKTTDGLTWLIRYYEETNALMLAGVIPKTEWDPGV
ncbi:MAG TPA: hypothetical protein VGO50_17375 [Pyrinomonadaceae bacterium]|jgi:hypothetical protein|nr:hypothetical protein [Pyrinomonadaceae bacterium]